jgi:Right handed beta helix region
MIPIQAATYYVDSVAGADINTGLTQTGAWRTLDKVSSVTFQPGDAILFKAGGSWTGTLSLHGSGTSGNPITVGRYGSGAKPLLQGAGAVTNVVELVDVSYWEIADLEITNAADPDNLHNGILVSSTSSQRYYHLYIRSVDVHDVDCPSNSGGGGIRMDCVLSDALIDGCNVHHIGGNGIDVHSNYSWIVPKVQETYDLLADTDVTVQNCTTSYCGDSGIWIWGAKHPLIQHCTAYDCNLGTWGAYVGIWIMNTEDAVIQYNNSYHHRQSWDGECINVDVLCFRTVVQYNYVHDNDYIGIIIYGYTQNDQDLNTDDVVVRYNIAEYCEGGSFALAGNQLSNTDWYNNTAYASPSAKQVTGTRFNGTVANTHRFSNNIFYQGTYDFSTFGDAAIQFSNNCYFNNDDSSRPDDAGAIIADPRLVAPGSGGDTLASVDGYRLMSESPCINAGISINDSGTADYWGNSAPIEARDVGAHEFQSPTSSPPVPPRNLRVLSAGCEVNPTNIVFYIDGQEVGRKPTLLDYLNDPLYIIVNYALQGDQSGEPFTSHGSSFMQVDWVRSYSLPSHIPIPPPAVTSLENGGFEKDTGGAQESIGWGEWSSVNANYNGVVVSGNSHSGNNHFRMEGNNFNLFLSQVVQVREAGIYTARAWIKNSGGEPLLSVKDYNGPNRWVPIPATNTWTLVQIKDITMAAASSIRVGLWFAGSGSTAFDDVEFLNQTQSISPPQNVHVVK